MKLFSESGPLNARHRGGDQYDMTVSIPKDHDGLTARECPEESCSPGFFKVKGGTGLQGQPTAFCPYCRVEKEPNDFTTAAQLKYIKDLIGREATRGIQNALGSVFKNSPRPNPRSFISVSWEFKPGSLPYVASPTEEPLKRDLTCPHCTLEHAVFGLATWCPDCGKDIFLTHVDAEFSVISAMLTDIPRRYETFGSRVAARDLENALEDVVSIFEATLRVMVRRFKKEHGVSPVDLDEFFRTKVRNGFQSIGFTKDFFPKELQVDFFGTLTPTEVEHLRRTFEKRHPITHNLGIVDRAYLKKVQTAEAEGRDVRLSNHEIAQAISMVQRCFSAIYPVIFSTATQIPATSATPSSRPTPSDT